MTPSAGVGRLVDSRRAPGVSRSSSSAARTASSAAVAGSPSPPAAASQRSSRSAASGMTSSVPLPLVPVVVSQHGQPDGPGVPDLAQLRHEHEVAERLRHLLAVHAHHAPGASSGARTARRWPPRTGRPRTRGAGRSGRQPPPCRSMVVPSSRSASAEHSMCQPGRPGPHSDSHAGSSGGRRLPQHEVERVVACWDRRGCRPARRPGAASRRDPGGSPARTARSSRRRSTRRPRPGRRGPGRAPCR